ncbi:MAG: biotin transporter BioY [Clostridia bacterium]|nr:biotin transporter BioY [Clostridia bacterium]
MKKNKEKHKKQPFKPLDIAYIGIFSALIALCSWISIPTTVPFTLQTFAVFAALAMLGGKRGFYAVLTYLLLGAIGVPVFSGFKGGIAALIGNTGGFLIGFLLLAAVYWLITATAGDKLYIKVIALTAGLLVCYAFGTAWFMFLYIKNSGAVSLVTVLGQCVFPFILPDAAKMALALLVARKIKLPEK